jgi:hypothetical protein
MLRQSIYGSLDFFSNQSLKVSHPILGISTNGMFVQHGSSSPLAILHTQSLALVVLVTSNSCDCCCLLVACTNLHPCGFLSPKFCWLKLEGCSLSVQSNEDLSNCFPATNWMNSNETKSMTSFLFSPQT